MQEAGEARDAMSELLEVSPLPTSTHMTTVLVLANNARCCARVCTLRAPASGCQLDPLASLLSCAMQHVVLTSAWLQVTERGTALARSMAVLILEGLGLMEDGVL